MNKILLTILITILYCLSLVGITKVLSAEIKYVESKQNATHIDIPKALKNINEAINKNPYEPRYYYEKAKYLIIQDNNADALKNLKKAQQLNKNNLVSLKNMAPIYSFLPKETAQNYYKDLKQEYSSDVGVLIQVAKYEKKLGLDTDYQNTIQMIDNLRPDLVEWAL